jgi:hypothetical protein
MEKIELKQFEKAFKEKTLEVARDYYRMTLFHFISIKIISTDEMDIYDISVAEKVFKYLRKMFEGEENNTEAFIDYVEKVVKEDFEKFEIIFKGGVLKA